MIHCTEDAVKDASRIDLNWEFLTFFLSFACSLATLLLRIATRAFSIACVLAWYLFSKQVLPFVSRWL
jgi:hypothetical protein